MQPEVTTVPVQRHDKQVVVDQVINMLLCSGRLGDKCSQRRVESFQQGDGKQKGAQLGGESIQNLPIEQRHQILIGA